MGVMETSKKRKAFLTALPIEVEEIAGRLGDRVHTARVRRKLRQEDIVTMTGLSRSTVRAVEQGSPTCSLGAVLSVLWHLGLAKEVDILADPGLDERGLALDISDKHRRVRIAKAVDNEF